MKRKKILSVLISTFVTCLFMACSNDSDAIDINVGTRSVTSSSYLTREEIQARLDDIEEKYRTEVIIDEGINIDLITDDVLMKLEKHLAPKQELTCNIINSTICAVSNNNDSFLINDSCIDDIMLMAAPPSGEEYSGSFEHSMNISCGTEHNSPTTIKIVWHTRTPNVLSSLSLSASITTGHGSGVSIEFSQVGGEPSAPSFKYSGSVNCNSTILKCDTIFMKDEMDDGLNHLYDIEINGEYARIDYQYVDFSAKHPFSGIH